MIAKFRVSKPATLLSLGLAALLTQHVALAADDPSIKGKIRDQIQMSMNEYISNKSVNSVFSVYDAVDGKLLKLKLDELHEGIVKKGDFYVSCADFKDQWGRKIDMDFLVLDTESGVKTTQAIVHSVDGKKRKYHLENS